MGLINAMAVSIFVGLAAFAIVETGRHKSKPPAGGPVYTFEITNDGGKNLPWNLTVFKDGEAMGGYNHTDTLWGARLLARRIARRDRKATAKKSQLTGTL